MTTSGDCISEPCLQSYTTSGLDHLPFDLKVVIINIFLSDAEISTSILYKKRRPPGYCLLALGATSHAWHDLVLPYVFREVNLVKRSTDDFSLFTHLIAPKYGRFCQSLGVSLPFHRLQSGKASPEFPVICTPYRGPTLVKSWDVERCTLLCEIVRSMPGIQHLTLVVGHCSRHWHYQRGFCQCLSMYDEFIAVFAGYSLRSLDVQLEPCVLCGNSVDTFVSSVLQTVGATVESVTIRHGAEVAKKTLFLKTTLHTLTLLPHLKTLALDRLYTYSHLARSVWKSPLRTLLINTPASDSGRPVERQDLSLALAGLPHTLLYLTLRDDAGCSHYAFSAPFPSHLKALRRLFLCIPVDSDLINYLSPCVARTIVVNDPFEDGFATANASKDDFDHNAFSRALRAKASFSGLRNLEFIIYSLPLDRMGKSWEEFCNFDGLPLSDSCADRGVTIKCHRRPGSF